MDKLLEFMSERYYPIHPPIIGGLVLDLYKLYALVTKNHGFEEVNRKNLWKEIANKLEIHIAFSRLRSCYSQLLHSFEYEKKWFGKLPVLQQSLKRKVDNVSYKEVDDSESDDDSERKEEIEGDDEDDIVDYVSEGSKIENKLIKEQIKEVNLI